MPQQFLSNGVNAITRRLFAQKLLSTVAIGAVPATAIEAPSASASHLPDKLRHKPEDLTDQDWDEVQARYKNLLRVYGSRLTAPETDHVLHILITNQYMLQSIRSFVVQNGDASACTLRLVT